MKLHRDYLKIGIYLIVIVLAVAVSGCNTPVIKATWLKPEAAATGTIDWWSLPAFRIDELNGTLTQVNDSSAIYLRFYSQDHRLAGRLKRAGLTTTFVNPEDNKAQITIEFPMSLQSGGGSFHANRYLPAGDIPATEIDEMLKLQSDDVRVTLENSALSGVKTPEQAEQMGIQARFDEKINAFEYLLKVDMKLAPSWLKPGHQIEVRIMSPALERPRLKRGEVPSEGEMGEHGMPPMGGGLSGKGRGSSGGLPGEDAEGRRDKGNEISNHQAIDYNYILQFAVPLSK
jgi:hypothetical protein